MTKRKYDSFDAKRKSLQEFFYARNTSTDAVESKFGIFPSEEGRKFYMKNGVFRYADVAIDRMLTAFQNATDSLCGTKIRARLAM